MMRTARTLFVTIEDDADLVRLLLAWMECYGVWALPNTGSYISTESVSLHFDIDRAAQVEGFLTEAHATLANRGN